jgi:hypothetical protein
MTTVRYVLFPEGTERSVGQLSARAHLISEQSAPSA